MNILEQLSERGFTEHEDVKRSQIIEDVVVELATEIVEAKGWDLRIRATHHKRNHHRHRNNDEDCVIQFGTKPMMDWKKRCGIVMYVPKWKAWTEVRGENMTQAEYIARLILHELAHHPQVKKGDRHYGSVHNYAFYEEFEKLWVEYFDELVIKLEEQIGVE